MAIYCFKTTNINFNEKVNIADEALLDAPRWCELSSVLLTQEMLMEVQMFWQNSLGEIY